MHFPCPTVLPARCEDNSSRSSLNSYSLPVGELLPIPYHAGAAGSQWMGVLLQLHSYGYVTCKVQRIPWPHQGMPGNYC